MCKDALAVTLFRSLLFSLLLILQPCWAHSLTNREVPSIEAAKRSLLAFWEKRIKEDPDTKLFQKTNEKGVYRIDTSVLPYKGRVKVLNVVVDVYTPVAEYDRHIAYGGVVETELLDAPNNIAELQPFSFKKWQRMGWFDYDTETSEWFAFNDWDSHFPYYKRLFNPRGRKQSL
jgi:hypothetical protein